MKPTLKTLFISAFAVLLFSAGSLSCLAQAKQISEKDKTELIQTILNRFEFKEKRIYLLSKNISAEQIPVKTDRQFLFVEPKEIKLKTRKKKGIEYYHFKFIEDEKSLIDFESDIVIYFERIYDSSRITQATTFVYECRKVADKWNIEISSRVALSSIVLK